MTATLEAQPAPPSAPPPTRTTYPLKEPWLSKRTNQALVVLGAWIVLYFLLKGHWTFVDGQPTTAVQDKLQHVSDAATTGRDTNWFFVYIIDPIRNVLDTYVTTVQDWIHSIGWTGPTFLATGIALVWAGWRYAILALAGFVSFGVLGLFFESMDTLTYTLCAVVLSVIAFGIGASCVGVAGCMMILLVEVTPGSGPTYTLLAFVIVIVGGLFIAPSAKSMISFALIIIVLIFRPRGLIADKL